MAFKFALLLAILPVLVSSFYTIGYFSSSSLERGIFGGKISTFKAAPDSVHVADLVARLSGYPAILREETLNIPTIQSQTKETILLELEGGVLPRGSTVVVHGSSFTEDSRGPMADSVVTVLASHGIESTLVRMSGAPDNAAAVTAWLQSQKQPVIILQHETPAAHHHVHSHRLLASTNSSTAPLSEFDISNYQICMWTGLVMVLLLLSAICSISTMEVIPDSLLYAKFQSTRAQKND